MIKNKYKPRPIRFIEIHEQEDWKIKIYSISVRNEFVKTKMIELAKKYLSEWLRNSTNYSLQTYKIATLILHEGKDGSYAIIDWWIGENMMQNHVYFLKENGSAVFEEYSDKGIFSCVWELEVLWFERNKWVKYVLSKAPKPDYSGYLKQHLNKN